MPTTETPKERPKKWWSNPEGRFRASEIQLLHLSDGYVAAICISFGSKDAWLTYTGQPKASFFLSGRFVDVYDWWSMRDAMLQLYHWAALKQPSESLFPTETPRSEEAREQQCTIQWCHAHALELAYRREDW